jgi:Mg-chelatase subunit ChlD
VAVLVDVSGSMKQSVKSATGAPERKMQIAKRRVLELIEQGEAAAAAKPDRPLQLAVYEFSGRDRRPSSRSIVPLGPPDVAAARSAINSMRPDGGTPIGDAIIVAQQDLAESGWSRQHIIVVTDGENTQGYNPADVVEAIGRVDEARRAAVYFIAFDVAEKKFAPVRDAGGLVLAADNEQELQQTLDYLFTGKILAEQPPAP